MKTTDIVTTATLGLGFDPAADDQESEAFCAWLERYRTTEVLDTTEMVYLGESGKGASNSVLWFSDLFPNDRVIGIQGDQEYTWAIPGADLLDMPKMTVPPPDDEPFDLLSL